MSLSPQIRTGRKKTEHLWKRRDAAGEMWRGTDKIRFHKTPRRWTKGGCCSLCSRGTRPRSRATRLAASPALPSSPAPPVSRHQPLSVQGGLRPPARRRHFQLFPGCTRTTHKTNKRRAAPAPASLPQPPTRSAPAHGPARRQQAPPTQGPAQVHTAR